MSTQVIEWAPFRLKAGTDEALLVEASEELQRAFLGKQPGFLGRELMKGEDGAFVDLVRWASRELAQQAMAKAAESAVCGRYFALMEEADHAEPGAGVSLFLQVKAY